MRDGFIKAAASTPEIRVADVDHNKKLICEGVDQAWKEGIQLLVYPELCLTGYTCGDLFWQEELLEKARQGLSEIVMHSLGKKMLIFVGLPWEMNGKLYNVAAAVSDGELLGLVPPSSFKCSISKWMIRSRPGCQILKIFPLEICFRRSIQKFGAVMGLGLLSPVR